VFVRVDCGKWWVVVGAADGWRLVGVLVTGVALGCVCNRGGGGGFGVRGVFGVGWGGGGEGRGGGVGGRGGGGWAEGGGCTVGVGGGEFCGVVLWGGGCVCARFDLGCGGGLWGGPELGRDGGRGGRGPDLCGGGVLWGGG